MNLWNVLAFLAVFTAYPAGAAQPGPGAPFVLGAENASGPWGKADGTGCGNDIVRAAYKAAGAEVRLEILPYARAKDMVLKGGLDGCFAMSWEQSFDGKLAFSREPLYRVSAVIFQNPKFPIQARTIDDLTPGLVLGTVRDYEYPVEIAKLAAKGIVFEETNSEIQNLQKLAVGRINGVVAVVDELKSADYLIRTAGVAGLVDLAFLGDSQGSYVGFSLSSARGLEAKRTFDKGFGIIRRNGVLKKIHLQWANQP